MKCRLQTTYPNDREDNESSPEYLYLSPGELDLILGAAGLKVPDWLALIIDVVPPPEARHDPPRNVLDRPEVQGEQQDDGDETFYEWPIWGPTTQQIHWNWSMFK